MAGRSKVAVLGVTLGVLIGSRLAKAIQAMEDPRPLPAPLRRVWYRHHEEDSLLWVGGVMITLMPVQEGPIRHFGDLCPRPVKVDWAAMKRRQGRKYKRSVRALRAAGFGFLVVPDGEAK